MKICTVICYTLAGNKYTLNEMPLQNNIDIHSRLKRFHRVMYGARFMTLAVQARGVSVNNSSS